MNITGSLRSRQERNSPMTSRGVAGVTTVSPGTDAYHPSKDCECVAPTEAPAPVTVRIISGMENCPPDIYRILAAWFTIWSIASRLKLMVISSTTGRRPTIAAPTPAPTITDSASGESLIRRFPYCSQKPLVTAKAPP